MFIVDDRCIFDLIKVNITYFEFPARRRCAWKNEMSATRTCWWRTFMNLLTPTLRLQHTQSQITIKSERYFAIKETVSREFPTFGFFSSNSLSPSVLMEVVIVIFDKFLWIFSKSKSTPRVDHIVEVYHSQKVLGCLWWDHEEKMFVEEEKT